MSPGEPHCVVQTHILLLTRASTAAKTPAVDGEYPRRVSLQQMMDENPLPFIPPGTVDAASMTAEATMAQAAAVVDAFNAAIAAEDAEALAATMAKHQAHFKDTLAFTSYYRTFSRAEVIAPALLHLSKLRGLQGGMKIDGAVFVPATPVLVRCCVPKMPVEVD